MPAATCNTRTNRFCTQAFGTGTTMICAASFGRLGFKRSWQPWQTCSKCSGRPVGRVTSLKKKVMHCCIVLQSGKMFYTSMDFLCWGCLSWDPVEEGEPISRRPRRKFGRQLWKRSSRCVLRDFGLPNCSQETKVTRKAEND